MQGGTTTSTTPAMEEEEEEERYVQLASRFFRVKQPRGASDAAMMPCRRLHYLDSCFLCKKAIACNSDIFMYKGDAAFCSEDCRQDQMDMDEALHAVARRHRLMPSSRAAASAAHHLGDEPPTLMRRRPTIANLAPRNPPVPAS